MWPGNSGYSSNSQNPGGPPAFPNSGGYVPTPEPPAYDQPQAPFFPSPQPGLPQPGLATRGFGGPPPVPRDNHPAYHQQHGQLGSGYPGQYAGSYAPPASPPTQYPPHQGPPGGYAPPPGPQGGYVPPQGPPGGYASPPWFPGGYTPGPPGGPGYGPPPGPPGGYNSPSGPLGGYRAPPGPPPMNPGYASGGPSPMPPTHQQSYGSQQGPGQQTQPGYFQSNRRKKALLIGINYIGQEAALQGCIEDVDRMKKFLLSRGYKEEDMVMLKDDSQDRRKRPTRQNIFDAMQWLVKDAGSNDFLFFHYSGHGGQTKDLDGDEEDGYDEVIYPVDFKTASHIVDDDMHSIMVSRLPVGCRLTAIFDSCHSGSALDLPYIYSTEGKIKEPNVAMGAAKGLMSTLTSLQRNNVGGVISGVTDLVKVASGNAQKADQRTKATRTSLADVISWSGCKDSQTSADALIGGRNTGAMSDAFLKALEQNPNPTYQELLVGIRSKLSTKYMQKPQLSSSHPIDTHSMKFII